MGNIYLFSLNNFVIDDKLQNIKLCKNNILKIENKTKIINIKKDIKDNESIQINLSNLESNNFYRVLKNNSDTYIELLSCSFRNLYNKYTTKSCEVFIYENSVRIIFNNCCYTYFFYVEKENYIIEKDDYLYIFNSKKIIIFNQKKITFNLLKIEKFNKKDNKIEFLCKIPLFFNYFLDFLINFDNNNIQIKKYKRGEINIKKQYLPHLFFYLCKFDFSDAKSYLKDPSLFDKIKNYIQNFEHIIEINNTYFFYNGTTFIPATFKIENNKILDFD